MTEYVACPDCGVRPGMEHRDGCDVERCPDCGNQLVSCPCRSVEGKRMPWTGKWPGLAECRGFSWYAGPPRKGSPKISTDSTRSKRCGTGSEVQSDKWLIRK